MRVLIVGGGIAGLAAAGACARAGLEPLVLEQAPGLGEVGAGISLTPPAAKGLEHLGCEDSVRNIGVLSYRLTEHVLATGEPFRHIDTRELADKFGKPWYTIYRPDLIDALLTVVPDGCTRVGARVVDFEETPEDVRVLLEGGEEVRGEVLIGADGLRSVVREKLFGPEDPRFTGFAAWRGTVRLPLGGILPGSERDWSLPEKWSYTGPGGTFHSYPVRRGELLNFVAVVSASDERRESWTLEGDPEQARSAFRDACPDVRAVLAAIEDTFVTAFYDRPPLERWGRGRVSLLGDAAHPILPVAGGAGAALGIEDAIAVGHCLVAHGRADASGGLREYELRRQPRTNKVLIQARHNITARFVFRSDAEYEAAERGRIAGLARFNPESGTTNWIRPEGEAASAPPAVPGMGWLWGFDPVGSLQQPVEELRTVVENPLLRPEARRAFESWRSALAYDEQTTWLTQQAGYERFCAETFAASAEVVVEQLDCGGVAALRVTLGGRPSDGPVVLHLHGGGFVLGSAASSVELAGRLAGAVGGCVVVVDYRRAPQHAYPAQLDDALAAYRWLVGELGDARRIMVSGEDAGGGLAVSLACALRDAGEALPAALYVVSPLADLTLSSASIDARSGQDPWLNRDFLTHLAACYIQSADPQAPLVSPLFANLAGLPPLLVHAATSEALADDASRLAAAAIRDGVVTTLHLFDDTVHSFVLFEYLPESAQALTQLTEHAQHATSTDHAAR